MPTLEEALEHTIRKGGTRPLIATHLANMPDKLRATAEKVLASPLSDQQVADAFTDEGYPVTCWPVAKYRKAHKLQRYAR